MALHELIYLSEATREIAPGELSSMLEQAREKNARLNVNGMLVYHQSRFMQLLEGEEADIFTLYARICHDDRNRHNYLAWDGPIASRAFADWSMAFVTPADLSLEATPAYSDFLQTGLLLHSPAAGASVARAFLTTLRNDFLKPAKRIRAT